jgi:hypothetical protein
MRLLISLLFLPGLAGSNSGPWPEILGSIGVGSQSRVVIGAPDAPVSAETQKHVSEGAILILEGESPLAESFGFHRGKGSVVARSAVDTHLPSLSIVWEKPLDLPVFEMPAGAQIFTRERWSGAPLVAGLRRGTGAVLWLAASPGQRGSERFPYLLAALCDLGLDPPFRSTRLWAFFDSAYRSRVDLDYFAARWRKAGIGALQVAAWHFFEPDAERDRYLARLIEACHREGILVYAWLELPHVSDQFWADHPEWREKTALLQDAQLDWRKLMNLDNRDCFRAVATGVEALAGRFDWDGFNLAELYFESLQGTGNPSRFTPMNDDVRAEFRKQAGFDPIEIFSIRRDDASRRQFLEFRASLARRMQEEWIGRLESLRVRKPHLDLVLTHVDDRFDTGMRDAIGADAARVLPLLDQHNVTFLIEDPATVWHLGPQRYHAIAERYRELTPHHDKLAIDLNIVDRYQDVYPTKQQTGTELFQLVHSAAANFGRVALYFENSLLAPDWALLPSAATAATRTEKEGGKALVDAVAPVGIPWRGAAIVDGHPWPVADDETVWLPAGVHTVEPSPEKVNSMHLVRLNGELKSARITEQGLEFRYQSTSRAIAILDRPPQHLLVDGRGDTQRTTTLFLPRGEHTVLIE